MKQYYHKYTDWEDFKNGMYKDTSNLDLENNKDSIMLFLTNSDLFYKTAKKVVNEWKISSLENISNKSVNSIAWLGQASCCYFLGVSEMCTKYAWKFIPEEKRKIADLVAYKVIKEYEAENREIYKHLGEKMLF